MTHREAPEEAAVWRIVSPSIPLTSTLISFFIIKERKVKKGLIKRRDERKEERMKKDTRMVKQGLKNHRFFPCCTFMLIILIKLIKINL